MNIPEQVDILGIPYHVKFVPVVDKHEYSYGQIDHVRQEILIDEELTQQRRLQVYWHEVVHGIFSQLAREELHQDEVLVQSMAIALHQLVEQATSSSDAETRRSLPQSSMPYSSDHHAEP